MTKVIRKPSTALYPVPAILASCGVDDRINIITLAWVGTMCSNPPLIGIGVRPIRYSYGLIQEHPAFVINLPRADQVRWVDYCGMVSGRDVDKWAACDFTPVPTEEIGVPLIAECPVNIPCRVQQVLSLGAHEFFIGEVLSVHVDEALLDEKGSLDIEKAEPFAYLNGDYRRVGELLGTIGYSKKTS